MSTFLDTLRSGRVLLMDGAMGTELQKVGLGTNGNASAWNLLHPERVRVVHRAYRAAGAEVFLTNTFLANHIASLVDTFRAERLVINLFADDPWEGSLDLIGEGGFRLADVGPVSSGDLDEDFRDVRYAGRALPLYRRADAVLLETCSSPRARYVIRRLRQHRRPPVLLSLCYLHDGSGKLVTRSGHSPEWFAERARAWGVAALGVNCGRKIGMDDVIDIIRRYRSVTDLPLFARPNAGTPRRVRKRWVYPLTPEAMAARLPELLEAGVAMVGCCCGTTPEHIAAMRPIVKAWNARRPTRKR
jgi:methionine synthase I (cobalamin-dependent)